MHSATLSTGIILLAPLCNAAAIVEVALNTSIITTILLLTSYKFKSAGDNEVCMDGLFGVCVFRLLKLRLKNTCRVFIQMAF
jgi:hypothetical protein